MTPYRRSDVVLVPFPFSEGTGAKRRPALIVSSEAYHRASAEVVIVQITSRTSAPPRPGDHRIQRWREAGLLAPSLARARLATLHRSLVLRRLGTLPADEMAGVSRAVAYALGLGPPDRQDL